MNVLIPIEGSFKEYTKIINSIQKNKYEKIKFYVDESMADQAIINKIEYKKTLSENKKNKFELIDKIIYTHSSHKNFESFCAVEFNQNYQIYANIQMQREILAEKFINIYEQLKNINYNILFCGAVSQFFTASVIIISKYLGKDVRIYTQSLIPDREFMRVDDDSFRSSLILKRIEQKIPQTECAKIANDVFSKILTRKKQGKYLNVYARTIIDDICAVRLIFPRLKISKITLKRIKYFIDKFIIRKIIALVWKFYSTKELPTSRYVFFPLHMPNEAQTLVRGGNYFDDIHIAQVIARLLPSGMLLVIKEHPGYEGWINLSELKKIKKKSNIILIDSKISSHEIIRKSEGVVTINSSVWFESLALNKPVGCLGVGVFSGCGIVNELKGYDDLHNFLNKIYSKTTNVLKKENVDRFVEAYYYYSLEGEFSDLILNRGSSFKSIVRELLGDI